MREGDGDGGGSTCATSATARCELLRRALDSPLVPSLAAPSPPAFSHGCCDARDPVPSFAVPRSRNALAVAVAGTISRLIPCPSILFDELASPADRAFYMFRLPRVSLTPHSVLSASFC